MKKHLIIIPILFFVALGMVGLLRLLTPTTLPVEEEPLTVLGAADASDPWWDADWSFRRSLVIDSSTTTDDIADFPMMIKLDSNRINYGNVINDGADIRFVNPNNSDVYEYEIEKYNEDGDSFLWVKIPTLDGATTTQYMYMYYGNKAASGVATTTGVWDDSYVLVQHLQEDPTDSDPAIKDSTKQGNDLSANNMAANDSITMQIDGGLDFDGTDDSLSITDASQSGLEPTDAITITAWIEDVNGPAANSWAIQKGLAQYLIKFGFGNSDVGCIVHVDGSNRETTAYDAADATTNLYHCAYDNGASERTVRLFVDGLEQQTLVLSGLGTYDISTSGDNFTVAGNSGSTRNLQIDEVRVSNVQRSADYMAADYESMTDDMITFGSEETVAAVAGSGQIKAGTMTIKSGTIKVK